MDDKLFKQKLSEVAEWKIPDTPRETSLNAKKRRGRKSDEEKYQEEHEQVFMELFDGVNPTYAPMITKLKTQGCDCTDCGRFCDQGRRVEFKHFDTNGTPHWRGSCKTCGLWEDPYTGEFTLTSGTESSIKWQTFHKETKGKYLSKGNKAKQLKRETPEHLIEIRRYPDPPSKI